MKKMLMIVLACLMSILCATDVYGMDAMVLCSVEDTLKGGMWDEIQRLDSSQTTFDHTVPEDGISLLIFTAIPVGTVVG